MSLLQAVLTKIMATGLSRISQKIVTSNAVHRALTNPDVQRDKVLETAVADIKQAIGRAGELDEAMAKFLEEFGSSGLLDQFAVSAVLEAPLGGAYLAFRVMYENHFGSRPENDARNLYLALRKMFRASIFSHSRDLSSIFMQRHTLEKLQQIEDKFDKMLLQRFSIGSEGSLDNFRQARPWLQQNAASVNELTVALRRALFPRFDRIRVEGPGESSRLIPVKSIYVSPKIVRNDDISNEISQMESLDLSGDELNRFVELLDKVIILGDPGGGKTTLARMVCRHLLCGTEYDLFPVFLPVRNYRAARSIDKSLSLLEFLYREIAQQSNISITANYRDSVQNLLELGRALVVFDGIDEVEPVADRREFVETIEQFSAHYCLCRFIATSRQVGYQKAPLESFSSAKLAPLTETAIRRYITRVGVSVFNLEEAEAEEELRRFELDHRDRVSEFIPNPLLLSLVTWLFFSSRRIPDNRLEIYRECALLLFQRWDKGRGLPSDIRDDYRLFALLSHIAANIYPYATRQAGVTGEWLLNIVTEYFQTSYNDASPSRAADIAQRFVDHLAGRAWVLKEVGPGTFEFTHRTFLEFFFGTHLNNKYIAIEELVGTLVPKIAQIEWVVPSHIALQMRASQGPAHSERVWDGLVKSSAVLQHPAATIEFIASCVGYLRPTEFQLSELAKVLIEGASERAVWKEALVALVQIPSEMRHAVIKGLNSGLNHLLTNDSSFVGSVFDWLKGIRVASSGAFMSERSTLSKSLVDAVAESFDALDSILKNATVSPSARYKLRVDLTPEFDENEAARCDAGLWQASVLSPITNLDWRAVDIASMFEELAQFAKFGGSWTNRHYARWAAFMGQLPVGGWPVEVPQRPLVVAKRCSIDLSNLNGPISDTHLASGLAFATVALAEMRLKYQVFPENFELREPYQFASKILDLCVEVLPNAQRDFYKAWLGSRAQLFVPPSDGPRRVMLDSLLSDPP